MEEFEMSKNKIKVKVCGTEFNILSEDNEEYTQKIASVVDRKMKQTLETNPRVSISNIAILTALEFCDLSKKLADQTENMKNQLNEYLEESQKAREEADDARKETEKLRSEIETLRQRLADKDSKKSHETSEPLSAPVRRSSRRGKRLITTESREEAAEDIMSFFGNSADDTAENSSDDNA
jgi:cell division protein ZapA (FtsZ GTPase activity inhibitor)